MNPPGGVSLIIHISIVIFGAFRYFIKNMLKHFGIHKFPMVKPLRRTTRWFKNTFVQQTLAYGIIVGIFLAISLSVFIQLTGIIQNKSNISFIASAISSFEKKITK